MFWDRCQGVLPAGRSQHVSRVAPNFPDLCLENKAGQCFHVLSANVSFSIAVLYSLLLVLGGRLGPARKRPDNTVSWGSRLTWWMMCFSYETQKLVCPLSALRVLVLAVCALVMLRSNMVTVHCYGRAVEAWINMCTQSHIHTSVHMAKVIELYRDKLSFYLWRRWLSHVESLLF